MNHIIFSGDSLSKRILLINVLQNNSLIHLAIIVSTVSTISLLITIIFPDLLNFFDKIVEVFSGASVVYITSSEHIHPLDRRVGDHPIRDDI